MEIEDLYALHSITNPQLAPNEQEAVFIRTQLNEKENDYEAHLFHIDLQTEEVTQWTFGHSRIASPKWTPDGRAVTFLKKQDDVQQVWLMQKNGGEARPITELPNGVSSYLSAPCGTKLYVTSIAIDRAPITEKAADKNDKDVQSYKVDGMKYKLDGIGLRMQNRVQHIAVVDVETGEVTQLTDGDFSYTLQAINHAGTQIVYSVNRTENKDWNFASPMYVYTIETQEEVAIEQREGYFSGAAFSFDDGYIAYVGADQTYKNATHSDVYVYDVTTSMTMNITEYIDAPVGDYVVADHQQAVNAPAVVWTDTNALYFQLSVMGDVRLYYATIDGAVYPASQEDEHVYDYAVMKSGNTALIAVSNAVFPGELFYYDITTGERTQLTHFNDAWLQQTPLVQPEPIVYRAKDDHFDIHGWLMKPANFEEGKTYPLIVEIHGGPHTMYGNSFFHELQLLAAQGYGVLYTNPRGSHGYSQMFVDACRHDYGGGDYEDIMAGVDYVLAQYDWINKDELGVTGGSYGGFMTNWIVGHTNRFKAAVTQRSISNWISFYGVSDIGYYFTDWQIGDDMTNVDKLWQHSPLKYASNVETPLLIMHSENDYRCPIEQAEQLYVTLKAQGKDTAFVRFPKSDHNLSRQGIPSLREARLREMVEWFARYLAHDKQ
ncbi:S9 family peptidase [Caryophanon latum]|uniref:Peptidase n=1 Tax=Caryophanon latum TaxID=33977 RepID=A0A1C0YWX5_9BACL|nr:S9 family peptidase [Caryophanon latum]OCS91678.1 peptidase [Caryophanon latum]